MRAGARAQWILDRRDSVVADHPDLAELAQRVRGSAGLVAVLADGRWDAGCSTETMGVAWRGTDMAEARVEIVAGGARD